MVIYITQLRKKQIMNKNLIIILSAIVGFFVYYLYWSDKDLIHRIEMFILIYLMIESVFKKVETCERL